jgi:hypothetical protein
MMKRKVLKVFAVLTLVFVVVTFIPTGAGTVHAAANTVFDIKGGQYIPVLIYNGMTDVASVGAYAQAKGAFAAINGTYFDAYATEDQVTAKGGDVNILRAFGSLYGAPLNFPGGVLIENGRLLHGAGYGSGPGQWGRILGWRHEAGRVYSGASDTEHRLYSSRKQKHRMEGEPSEL